MPSWTEIAVGLMQEIAEQNGCELESFSLDEVETYEQDGVEMVMVKASARIAPADDLDAIPGFETQSSVVS